MHDGATETADVLGDVDVDVREDGDVNLSGDDLVVEVARKADGTWEFWAVRLGDNRFGQAARLIAGPVAEALEYEYQRVMEARRRA